MNIRSCVLCSILVVLVTLRKSNGAPSLQKEAVTATKSSYQPQAHVLNLVKRNKTNIKNFVPKNDTKHFTDDNWNRQPGQKNANLIHSDDLLDNEKNTLESTNDEFSRFRNDSGSGIFLRFKQSIPVLEPVRHLLNTVRDGGFNHTTHFNKTRHQLIGPGEIGDVTSSSPSSAIETEAERDMVLHGSESTGFQLLDFFGSIGGMIWDFLMNVKKWFAASAGNASAAFSGGSF